MPDHHVAKDPAVGRTCVYYHSLFLRHETGDHPENERRLVAAKRAFEESGLDLEWVVPEAASVATIARVHDLAYVDSVRRLAESGGGRLDWDTVVSPDSYEAALLAAGAGVAGVTRALCQGDRCFLLIRPPGHHACRGRGMGFCIFNNIAVAACHALEELAVERVFIFDWDVHHGNGTQAAFYSDRRVLFMSTHMAGHYPGTGMTREIGEGEGRGYTVNVPLQPGGGDGSVRLMFESLLDPLVRAFRPQVILVSAGYDSERGDPLGGLTFSRQAFQWMAARLMALGQEVNAAGPLFFLEGGYVPERVAASAVATVRGLVEGVPQFEPNPTSDERADVREALEELKPYWSGVL